VAGLCCLTNKNDPDDMQPVTHEAVLEQARRLQSDFRRLVAALLPHMAG